MIVSICLYVAKLYNYILSFFFIEDGKLEMVFTPAGGKENRMEVFNFKDGGGVAMTMYNTDEVCPIMLSILKSYICL